MWLRLSHSPQTFSQEKGARNRRGGGSHRRNNKGANLTMIFARALALECTRRSHPKFADIVDWMLLKVGMLRRAASGGNGGDRLLDLSTVPCIASGMLAKCDAVTTTIEVMTTMRIPTTAAMRIPTMVTLPRAAARRG